MSLDFKLDISESGLGMLHRPWEITVLESLWASTQGHTVKKIWENVNPILGEGNTISKASINIFLSSMAEQGLVEKRLESCKGGFRGRYSLKMNRSEYEAIIVGTAIKRLLEEFPDTVNNAIRMLDNLKR